MAFPKIEDWTAPWGTDDDDFDAEKAKKLVYGLSKDKDSLKTKLEVASTAKKETEEQLETANKGLSEAQAAGNEKVVGELQTKVTKLEGDLKKAERENLALTVADDKGIPLAQASRLRGETKEELEEDADDFLQSFGAKGEPNKDPDEDEDEEGEEDNTGARRVPQKAGTPLSRNRNTHTDDEVNLDLVPRL